MARWVADATLYKAARVIERRPGLLPEELAEAVGLQRSSITAVLSELRATGEILPRDVIRARPDAPFVVEEETPQRILRRARRGLVVLSELPRELDEDADEVAAAIKRLRALHAIFNPPGLWPCAAHHDPITRARLITENSR